MSVDLSSGVNWIQISKFLTPEINRVSNNLTVKKNLNFEITPKLKSTDMHGSNSADDPNPFLLRHKENAQAAWRLHDPATFAKDDTRYVKH